MLAVFIFFSSSFTAESLENENVQAETFCSFYDFLYQSAAQDLVNVFLIVIRNWKIVWKHGLIVDIFAWTWNIWRGRTENTSKQREILAFGRNSLLKMTGIAYWKWLWGCFSHFLFSWSWWKRFWGSSEDRYRPNLSQMLRVRYSLLNDQNTSVNDSEKSLVTRTPPT